MSLRISHRLLTLIALTAVVGTMFLFTSGSFKNMRGSLLESYTLFTLFDTNNDSRLSETEMRKGFGKALNEIPLGYVKYDVNHDNKTDAADLQDIIDSLRAALQSVCGNGIKESAEQCDNGTQNGVRCSVPNANLQCTYCSAVCVNTNYSPPPACGNGFTESGEQCDDGNTVSQDNCSSACMFETHLGCLNNACVQVLGFGPNICTSNTQCIASCGNGAKEGAEQCDDGNQVNTDSCTTSCKTPVCGDGYQQGTEQCDDGNGINTDTCNNSCQTVQLSCTSSKPSCNLGGAAMCCGNNEWKCSLFNSCSCYCSGSTYVQGANCPASLTNPCVPPPPPPSAVCGNGVREGAEQCDDGNTTNGDGCSSTCTLPACGPLVEYNVTTASSGAGDIVLGPDKNLWFTEFWARKIGRITPSGGLSEFISPVLPVPYDITAGKDGNLWFTNPSRIGRVTQTGAIRYFPVTVTNDLYGIAAGSDGNLWITNGTQGGDAILKMTPGGAFNYFAVAANSMPVAITSGPDNNLWFTEMKANAIGRITTAGDLREFPLPMPRTVTAVGAQSDIHAGPDGNVWFVMQGKNTVGRITPAGTPTEFPLAADRYPTSITAGKDGNLWFTQGGPKKIGKITSTGAITELALPFGTNPNSIAAGPDGYLWYTDSNRNKIGKIAASCTIVPFCGNGAVDANEECDDGNQIDIDSCTTACKNPYCGDGFKQANEECDAGVNDVPWCTTECKNPVCGDGYVNGTEQCDDMNTYNDDNCSNQCTRPHCGDGIRQGDYEQCDDGNNDPTDDCTICQPAYCGDGFVRSQYETCDAGSRNGQPNSLCTSDCRSTIIYRDSPPYD